MRPRVLGSRSASGLQKRMRSYALTTGIMETIGRCDLAMSFGVRVAENSISLKKLKRSKNWRNSVREHSKDTSGLGLVTLTNQLRLYYAT